MAEWISNTVINTILGSDHHEQSVIVFQPGDKFERQIVHAYLEVDPESTDIMGFWTRQGVLWMLQMTYGDPPPAPTPIPQGGYGGRDILDSRYTRVGGVHPISGRTWAPDTGVMEMDTNVTRGPFTEPAGLWLVWGLPDWSLTDLDSGYWRYWLRTLYTPAP